MRKNRKIKKTGLEMTISELQSRKYAMRKTAVNEFLLFKGNIKKGQFRKIPPGELCMRAQLFHYPVDTGLMITEMAITVF
ncbi:hypothetical protein [Spirochaeta dissipatitropha]